MQGPNYSITVALKMVSVWTKVLEAKLPCKTSSFIDDSSIRTNEGLNKKEIGETAVQAIKLSQEFGEMAGTLLNKKKIKILTNTKQCETMIKKGLPELKPEAFVKAMKLVGGIVTTGQKEPTKNIRATLREEKEMR